MDRSVGSRSSSAQNHGSDPPIEEGDNGRSGGYTHTPLNTLPRSREDPSRTKTLVRHRPHPVRRATAARPETHQNLIYSDKEHALPYAPEAPSTASPSPNSRNNLSKQLAPEQHRQHRTSCFSAIHPGSEPEGRRQWVDFVAITSTPFPKPEETGGGDRTRTDDPLLAKQVLSQLSYTPCSGQWSGHQWSGERSRFLLTTGN